jgi:hypothetical protein
MSRKRHTLYTLPQKIAQYVNEEQTPTAEVFPRRTCLTITATDIAKCHDFNTLPTKFRYISSKSLNPSNQWATLAQGPK